MKSWLNKTVRIIGMPFDMGASQFGARLGPEAIRLAGLNKALKNLGYQVNDQGNLQIRIGYEPIVENNLKNYELVKEAMGILAKEVYQGLVEEEFPLIIGGDHSQVFGSMKGLLKAYDNPGIIYFDAHADINTEKTSLTGNMHGMPIAFLIGEGYEEMTKVFEDKNYLKPENIVYIGLRDLDPGEIEIIRDLGIKAYSVDDIDRLGLKTVMDESISYIDERADQVHISFDVDCLDPNIAPGTGVKVSGGLTFREAKTALMMASKLEKIVSAEFVEVNPLLDKENLTGEIAVSLIERLFGKNQL